MVGLLIKGFIKLVILIGIMISQLVQLSVGAIFFICTLPILIYVPFVWFAGLFMDKKEV